MKSITIKTQGYIGTLTNIDIHTSRITGTTYATATLSVKYRNTEVYVAHNEEVMATSESHSEARKLLLDLAYQVTCNPHNPIRNKSTKATHSV